MVIDFSYKRDGLNVTFQNLSTQVPENSTYLWDFGVDGGESSEKNPEFTYSSVGNYVVTLKITTQDSVSDSYSDQILISDFDGPSLSSSIYWLINQYIPSELIPLFKYRDKRNLIEKWQLYCQPLVTPAVDISEYNNELKYGALENQLIMQLAAYEWLINQYNKLLWSLSNTVDITSKVTPTDSEQESDGKVKKIVTGPTEAEFFNDSINSDNIGDILKSINSALSDKGIIGILKQNICMLSQGLNIYLPICKYIDTIGTVEIGKPIQGFLDVPNPESLLT